MSSTDRREINLSFQMTLQITLQMISMCFIYFKWPILCIHVSYNFCLQLKKHGYHNIDVADPCEAMVDAAKKINAYNKYMICGTGDDQQMPIPDSK